MPEKPIAEVHNELDRVLTQVVNEIKSLSGHAEELLEAASEARRVAISRVERSEALTLTAATAATHKDGREVGFDARQHVAKIQREAAHDKRCERALRFLIDVFQQREDEIPHDPVQQALKHAKWHYVSYRTAPTLDKMDDKFVNPPTTVEVLEALEAWMRTSTFGMKERLSR